VAVQAWHSMRGESWWSGHRPQAGGWRVFAKRVEEAVGGTRLGGVHVSEKLNSSSVKEMSRPNDVPHLLSQSAN
jgi:hypothetical protein